MGLLDNRVAIVTGGASGLGRAVAERVSAEGGAVVIADIAADRAEEAAEELRAGGGEALAVAADVSVEADVVSLVGRTVAAYGRLDFLHNNAAALGPDVFPYDTTIVTMEVDVWDRTMAVNLRGVMLGCKHAIPVMREGGGGSIVSTSSLSALIGEDTHLAYACSKAAIGALDPPRRQHARRRRHPDQRHRPWSHADACRPGATGRAGPRRLP